MSTMDLNKSVICPKCGSKNIYAGKKGFNTGRAIAGGLLTGNIFVVAAAGGIGANKVVLTCLECGHTFNIGEGGKALPTREEIEEFRKRTIPRAEMPKTAMFKCDCGKVFSGELPYPYCPSCGRKMKEKNIATKDDLGYSKKGCLGMIIIPIAIMSSLLFLL